MLRSPCLTTSEELLQGALPRFGTPGSDRARRTSENPVKAKFAESLFHAIG
jgi:hypothetical protein